MEASCDDVEKKKKTKASCFPGTTTLTRPHEGFRFSSMPPEFPCVGVFVPWLNTKRTLAACTRIARCRRIHLCRHAALPPSGPLVALTFSLSASLSRRPLVFSRLFLAHLLQQEVFDKQGLFKQDMGDSLHERRVALERGLSYRSWAYDEQNVLRATPSAGLMNACVCIIMHGFMHAMTTCVYHHVS